MSLTSSKAICFIIGIFIANLNFAQLSNEGLLAYFPFDGNVNDLGPSMFDVDLIGGSFVENEFGSANSALELNGSSDYVNLSSFAVDYRDNASELSVYFRIRFIETSNNQTILSLGNSGESLATNVFEIEYENNQLQVETEVGTATTNHELQIDDPETLFDDQWHEILITFDTTSLKYYRDGSLLFDDVYVPAETTTSDLFLGAFGGSGSNSCCFGGFQIDELQFYSRILDENVLSNEDVSISEFTMYPNPARDNIKIQSKTSYEEIEVRVVNATGQIVKSFTYSNPSLVEIDVNDLPAGIYLIELIPSQNKLHRDSLKFIKE